MKKRKTAKTKTSPKTIETALRKFSLGFPETKEDRPWGHYAMKVKNKSFVFLGGDTTDELSLSVKLPISGVEALSLPFAKPTGYGLGRSGWVSASFGAKDKIPLELLKYWIEESYRSIAPKSLVKAMDGFDKCQAATKKKKAP